MRIAYYIYVMRFAVAVADGRYGRRNEYFWHQFRFYNPIPLIFKSRLYLHVFYPLSSLLAASCCAK